MIVEMRKGAHVQRTIRSSWLRHFDDGARAIAQSTLGGIIAAIHGGSYEIRDDEDDGVLEVAVRWRVGSKKATSSARCVLSGSTLEVRVPAKTGWSEDVVSIVGEGERLHGTEPMVRLHATLDLWQIGLSPCVEPDEEFAAAKVLDNYAALLRAAAQTLDPTWSAAAIAGFGSDVLAVLVEFDATGPARSRLFTSDHAQAPTGRISAELVRAFHEAAGGFLHAMRLNTETGDLLPQLLIGLHPRVRVVNDGDVMAIMRAVAAMPADARLMLPGEMPLANPRHASSGTKDIDDPRGEVGPISRSRRGARQLCNGRGTRWQDLRGV